MPRKDPAGVGDNSAQVLGGESLKQLHALTDRIMQLLQQPLPFTDRFFQGLQVTGRFLLHAIFGARNFAARNFAARNILSYPWPPCP